MSSLNAQRASEQQSRERFSSETTDGIACPIYYTRDPGRLTACLVPFPTPHFSPPPLVAPAEGEKEGRFHKVQRKWEEEIREAKTNPAKIKIWKGLKGRAEKGIDAAMSWTKSSNLEFLSRVPDAQNSQKDKYAYDGAHEDDTFKGPVALREMILVYPESMPGTQAQIREEFVNNMLRTKTKAQRDAIISTGLIPVAFGIDILATLIWPFGGLGEIDSVWAYASIRGAKTARSVTKRLGSTGTDDRAKLELVFTCSSRLEVLLRYLGTQCHDRDAKTFPIIGIAPTEEEVLKAIGWTTNGRATN